MSVLNFTSFEMAFMRNRSLLFLGVALLASAAIADQGLPAIKPTTITFQKSNAVLREVAAELSKSPSGIAVAVDDAVVKAKCPVSFSNTPFWEALESAAAKSSTRLVLRDAGRTIALEPLAGRPRASSSISGPFRVVAREVTGRVLLDEATVSHSVRLTAHWEPRMPVYRIDIFPRITQAKDDRGAALMIPPRVARDYPTGASHDLTVEQISGLTRDSKRIAVLAGEFRAVAAERLLNVPFQSLAGKLPIEQKVEGVKVSLKSFAKDGDLWIAELLLEYPPNHPNFESFEEQRWLRDTRLRLISPAARPADPDSEEVIASGRFVTATYRFKVTGDPRGKGWSLVCQTPSPLVEMSVPFTLKDIPIP